MKYNKDLVAKSNKLYCHEYLNQFYIIGQLF